MHTSQGVQKIYVEVVRQRSMSSIMTLRPSAPDRMCICCDSRSTIVDGSLYVCTILSAARLASLHWSGELPPCFVMLDTLELLYSLMAFVDSPRSCQGLLRVWATVTTLSGLYIMSDITHRQLSIVISGECGNLLCPYVPALYYLGCCKLWLMLILLLHMFYHEAMKP